MNVWWLVHSIVNRVIPWSRSRLLYTSLDGLAINVYNIFLWNILSLNILSVFDNSEYLSRKHNFTNNTFAFSHAIVYHFHAWLLYLTLPCYRFNMANSWIRWIGRIRLWNLRISEEEEFHEYTTTHSSVSPRTSFMRTPENLSAASWSSCKKQIHW